MRHKLLTLFLLLFLGEIYAQKNIDKYAFYTEFESYRDGDIYVTNLLPNIVLKQKINNEKNVEYFEIEDTSCRSYVQVENLTIMVDSLVIKNYDQYSMAFQIHSIYLITHKKDTFAIVRSFDGYQVGTEIQDIFIIFGIGRQCSLQSVYMVMNPEIFSSSKVKVYFNKDELRLKGDALVQIRKFN